MRLLRRPKRAGAENLPQAPHVPRQLQLFKLPIESIFDPETTEAAVPTRGVRIRNRRALQDGLLRTEVR